MNELTNDESYELLGKYTAYILNKEKNTSEKDWESRKFLCSGRTIMCREFKIKNEYVIWINEIVEYVE